MKINHCADFSKEKEGDECIFYALSQEDNHMTGDQSLFSDINKSVRSGIRLGDEMIVQADSKGTITVHTKIGTKNIHDILLISKLAHNLLSIGQMMEQVYVLHFEEDSYTISERKTKKLLAIIKMKNMSFSLKWSYIIETALKAQEDNS
ncbi:hypothetical protein AHAS_Ahas19G0281400 [Arachis hypogaea]